MTTNRPHLLLPLLLLITPFMNGGCRASLRTNPEAGSASPIVIRLLNLNSIDSRRSELLYTMSGCGAATASGTKLEGTGHVEILFNSQNVRAGDFCEIKVQSSDQTSDLISWMDEPGTMYLTKKVKIALSSGKLAGLATLQQLYIIKNGPSTADSLWKLKSTVKSPAPFAGVCTCSLTCKPTLPNTIAKLDIGSDNTAGTCLFTNLINDSLESTACSILSVQCGGDIYEGNWPAGTTVNGKISKDAELPLLTLVKIDMNQDVDSVIDVTLPTP